MPGFPSRLPTPSREAALGIADGCTVLFRLQPTIFIQAEEDFRKKELKK